MFSNCPGNNKKNNNNSKIETVFPHHSIFLLFPLQDETNHLFPQANRTKVMSTNQTIQTQTIFFLFLIFFFKLRTDVGGREEEIDFAIFF